MRLWIVDILKYYKVPVPPVEPQLTLFLVVQGDLFAEIG
jgi:hypothetical protein